VELTRVRRGEYRAWEHGHGRVRGWEGIRWQRDEEPPKTIGGFQVERLYDAIAERDTEIRGLRTRVKEERRFKDRSNSRHKKEAGEIVVSNGSAAHVPQAQDEEISTEDIDAIVKQLSVEPAVQVTGSGREI